MSIFCQGPACSAGQQCVATLGVDKQDELSVGAPAPGRQYGVGGQMPKTWKTMPVLESSRSKDNGSLLDDMSIGLSEPDEGWELLEQAVAEASPQQRERLELMLRRKRQGREAGANLPHEPGLAVDGADPSQAAQTDAQKRSLEFSETMQALSNLRQSLARQPEFAGPGAATPRSLRPQMPPAGVPGPLEPHHLQSPRAVKAARAQDSVRAAAALAGDRIIDEEHPVKPVDSLFVNAGDGQDTGTLDLSRGGKPTPRKERSCSPFVMLCADRDKAAKTDLAPIRRPTSSDRIRSD